MTRSRFKFPTALTMLCMVLMAVSSAASSAQAVHDLEHRWDAAAKHDHAPVNEITVAFVELDEAGGTADLDGPASTGHHHQGDGHSNLLMLGSVALHIDWTECELAIAAQQTSPGTSLQGPERPPKHLTASI